MSKSSNITGTNYRLRKAIEKANELSTGVSSKELSKTVRTGNKLETGVVQKWFTPLNKASVKLSSGKVVSCVVLHNMINKDFNCSYTPDGVVLLDKESQQYYVSPNTVLKCVVCELVNNSYVLVGFINSDLDFKTNAGVGEFCISVGGSKLSITGNRINIVSDDIFVNGSHLDDYYKETTDGFVTKDEVVELINTIVNGDGDV